MQPTFKRLHLARRTHRNSRCFGSPRYGGSFIDCSPVVSFLPGVGHDGSRNNLLGPEAPEELVQRFSSELQVSKDTPPAFLVHTADDWVRPVNSLRYASALQEAGVRAELHLFHEGGHGYGMRRPDLPVGQWPELLTAWMRSAGFLGTR